MKSEAQRLFRSQHGRGGFSRESMEASCSWRMMTRLLGRSTCQGRLSEGAWFEKLPNRKMMGLHG